MEKRQTGVMVQMGADKTLVSDRFLPLRDDVILSYASLPWMETVQFFREINDLISIITAELAPRTT